MSSTRQKINIYDYLVSGAVLLLAFISGVFFYLRPLREAEKARLTVGGKLEEEICLKKDGEYRLDFMTLQISDGRIRVSASDCPAKICVERGWISYPNQRIVCLPNRTLISVSGSGEEKYDAVTY